MTELFSV